jgi:hypothetical protein
MTPVAILHTTLTLAVKRMRGVDNLPNPFGDKILISQNMHNA